MYYFENNILSLQKKSGMKIELKLTSDGSHTLYVPEIDENYHSTHGAIQESTHIFILSGLIYCKKNVLNILEIGFGTGLNALLTAIEAEKSGMKIHFCTLEKYPVPAETALKLNYSKITGGNALFEKIQNAGWDKNIEISNRFSINKINCDFTEALFSNQFDLVYFDAFSPEKQPEMWTEKQFQKIFDACNEGAILTTYCAKGAVRRALQSVGFMVERLPGPPGKREILRATKPAHKKQ